MKPDTYQQAVIDDAASGTGHRVVRARAGSGKTSTIVNAIERVPRGLSVLVLAFNTRLKPEIEGKLAARGLRAEVSTLNSYGHRHCRAQLERGKTRRMAELACPGAPRDYLDELTRAVGLAKGHLTRDEWAVDALIDKHDLDIEEHRREAFCSNVIRVLDACAEHSDTVDFDDQIYLPVTKNTRLWQYDRVFVDETQDLTVAQIRMAIRACRKGGRVCAVGDDRQAIYGFRGADSRAMPRVIDELGAEVLPLSVSYRCARSVIIEAQKLVPDIEWAPTAPLGTVTGGNLHDIGEHASPGDFVVSRTNAPLVKACMGLLRAGTPAVVLGKDVSAELDKLIRRSKARSVDALMRWLDAWLDREVKRAMSRNPPASADRSIDTHACLEAIADGCDTLDEVQGRIKTLLEGSADEGRRVTLMSTHKAKGLEAGRVWLLRDTYNPDRSTEEANLLYVGITRAQRELVYVEAKEAKT